MPSTVIRSFSYDRSRGELDIVFTSGARYRYFGVPPEVHEGLEHASSKGEYFNRHIARHFYYLRLQAAA